MAWARVEAPSRGVWPEAPSRLEMQSRGGTSGSRGDRKTQPLRSKKEITQQGKREYQRGINRGGATRQEETRKADPKGIPFLKLACLQKETVKNHSSGSNENQRAVEDVGTGPRRAP